MELQALGFDAWFQEKREESPVPECGVARVTAVNKNSYLVRNESGEVFSELSGKMMFQAESGMDFPAVGDWAYVQYFNDESFTIIHKLFPRRSILRRKTPGKKIDYQVIASNIDVAFVVQSCDYNFNLRRLERYLVMAREGRIEPVLLLTKSDLVGPGELDKRISAVRESRIDCGIIALSAETGEGMDEFTAFLKPAKTYCMLGSSGVGKTTLLNHLVGSVQFETNEVRVGDGKGKHTTTRRHLVVLEGGAMVIDTPGMREMGAIDVGSGIDEIFSDLYELTKGCRFSNCTHTTEIGCALLSAVESGEVSKERYRSYRKLQNESEYHQMSYVEKRRKDKKFGQYVKTVMKDIRK